MKKSVNILGLEKYTCDRDGNIYGTKTKKLLKYGYNKQGYKLISLHNRHLKMNKSYPIHLIVLATFKGSRPNGLVCAHLDGNKLNNKASNLDWVTAKENAAHKLLHGTYAIGIKSPRSKLSINQLKYIYTNYYKNGKTQHMELSKKFGVHKCTIFNFMSGKSYGYELKLIIKETGIVYERRSNRHINKTDIQERRGLG
jgi:hypothetical protein